MKTLITVLKSIFIPFSAFAFLIFGFAACFCSGIIEFFVLSKLLAVPGLNINSDNWAALLVLILEGSKLTLHFYGAALNKKNLHIDEFNVKSRQRLIVAVKNTLVILSLVCSLICIVNVLYYDHDQKIEQEISNVNTNCDKKLKTETTALVKKKNSQIKNGLSTLESEAEHISYLQKQLENVIKQIEIEIYINKRGDLQEEAQRIRDDLNNSQNTYYTHKQGIEKKAESVYNKELKKLESLYGPNGSERITNMDSLPPEIMRKGDNTYLSNFLLSLTRTFGKEGYSRKTYFFFSICLALAVSIILELCISLSQMLLTISVDSFLKILGELPQIEKGKFFVQTAIWLMFSILIATSIYLISSIILDTAISGKMIRTALISYGITFILLNIVIPEPKNDGVLLSLLESNLDSQKVSLIKSLQTTFFQAFIPSALSFIIFTIVGFLTDGNLNYNDFNSIAIAIGGLFANSVKFQKCEFTF